ncbi:cytochrome c oxidase subunit 8B, mitochondrial [Erpetoichthys calabaricus]|uniref:cytochrome c oxidase subunit 8B, mitochondrial n=1 Tax=Erpetoichthys calabaricus TaxID=27687 RepID=UPI0010A096DA|nr:cytochrome c oxidase subunit 8B, mitochondrial [Erpetoichthys calabaricus]
MSALCRHLKVLSGTLVRSRVLPKASITSKPPKEVITPAQSTIAMAVMFVTILLPSGWILAHLEDYKHKK